ncbi:hypothetical protein B0H16DRAFT_1695683 [Mycena metata]|uniref:Uncharacterized protein n=1 Tax=Mycena metata TaxID=1033252 RepID=A0AAD7MVS1_9AGAR|nr:hypothetical protein B0H16DRAFT_1695683 [Mycena metata]
MRRVYAPDTKGVRGATCVYGNGLSADAACIEFPRTTPHKSRARTYCRGFVRVHGALAQHEWAAARRCGLCCGAVRVIFFLRRKSRIPTRRVCDWACGGCGIRAGAAREGCSAPTRSYAHAPALCDACSTRSHPSLLPALPPGPESPPVPVLRTRSHVSRGLESQIEGGLTAASRTPRLGTGGPEEVVIRACEFRRNGADPMSLEPKKVSIATRFPLVKPRWVEANSKGTVLQGKWASLTRRSELKVYKTIKTGQTVLKDPGRGVMSLLKEREVSEGFRMQYGFEESIARWFNVRLNDVAEREDMVSADRIFNG